MLNFTVRPTSADDWERVRALRLEAVRDTPIGFVESEEHVLALGEADWRARGERGSSEGSVQFVAADEEGRWLGIMSGWHPSPAEGPFLLGVYVVPDARGDAAGVADALLTAVVAWASTQADRLLLHVHEDNERAEAYYRKHGFAETGNREPYALDPSKTEIEMLLDLSD